MAGFLWALLGVAAGVCIAFQAPINAQLGRGLGIPVAAAMVSFLAGAIVLGIVTVIVSKIEGTVLDWRAPAPWLYVGGGCLGGIYVTAALLLTPRIGATALMAFAIAGQLCAGLLIDRFGMLGVAVRELSVGRMAGAVMLCAGVLMIRLS